MGQHIAIETAQPVRRKRSRLATCLPARLTTLHGTEFVILNDISLTGARVTLRDRRGITASLCAGNEVVLEWGRHDAFGSLIWTAIGMMGLQFDMMIDPRMLIATRDMQDELAHQGGLGFIDRQNAQRWAQGG